MAAPVRGETTLEVGTPTALFQTRISFQGVSAPDNRQVYDVTADGQRFVMVREGTQDSAAPHQINVVLNWFEELKQRVPTGQ